MTRGAGRVAGIIAGAGVAAGAAALAFAPPAARGNEPSPRVILQAPGERPRVAVPAEEHGAQVVKLGANASLGGRRVFPDDNAWNVDVSRMPVDPASDSLINTIGADLPLHPDFGQRAGIPYVVVSGSQPRQPVAFDYPDESDAEYYPIPRDAPREEGSDHHILMIDRDHWRLFELFAAEKKGELWHAGSGAVFDLRSNALRPAGWTSADAAGLPIFPGLLRADEVFEQHFVSHALRFTVRKTRKAYTFPARHYASRNTDPHLPPMGMRVRLKQSFDISRFSPTNQVILKALKQYGMLLADNGGDWFFTGAPDTRWNDDELGQLKQVKGRDFEVIAMGTLVTQ